MYPAEPMWPKIPALYVHASESLFLIPLLHLAFPLVLFLGVCVWYTGNMSNALVPTPDSSRFLHTVDSRDPPASFLWWFWEHTFHCQLWVWVLHRTPPWRIIRKILYGNHPTSVLFNSWKCHLWVCFCKNLFLKVLSAWLSRWGEKSKMSSLNQASDFPPLFQTHESSWALGIWQAPTPSTYSLV